MPNPKPPIENLTWRQGAPRKGRKRINITLPPEVIEALDRVATQQDWDRSYTIEQFCRAALGLPTDYSPEDLGLIVQGAPIE